MRLDDPRDLSQPNELWDSGTTALRRPRAATASLSPAGRGGKGRGAASRLSISGSEAGRREGAGADVAGGSGGSSAPIYCSRRRRRRVRPFSAPAGPRREGARAGSRSEQSPSASGGGGRRERASERAGGGAARGPLTRFRLSAARARAASARVTPERKRDSPGAAARERPWPTRTSSSTSSSETQVGEPGPERGGERRGRPGSPRPFPQCWQCRRRGGSARGRGGVSPPPLRRAPPAASALCLDGLGPLAAASGPG